MSTGVLDKPTRLEEVKFGKPIDDSTKTAIATGKKDAGAKRT